MNRGSRARWTQTIEIVSASMRPRFMNRGSAWIRKQHPPYDCGFNEAPIHESGKSRHI